MHELSNALEIELGAVAGLLHLIEAGESDTRLSAVRETVEGLIQAVEMTARPRKRMLFEECAFLLEDIARLETMDG